MGLVAFLVFVGLVLLRAGLVLFGAALILRPVSSCPACFRPTLLLRRPWLRRLAPWMEWRWCPQCGWEGPGKRRARAGEAGPRIVVRQRQSEPRVNAPETGSSG